MAALPALPTPAPSPRVDPGSGGLPLPPPPAGIEMLAGDAAPRDGAHTRNSSGCSHANNSEDARAGPGREHDAHVCRPSPHRDVRASTSTRSDTHYSAFSDVPADATVSASIPSRASLSPLDIILPHSCGPAGRPTCRANPAPLLTPELELELGTATSPTRCTCADADADSGSDSDDGNRALRSQIAQMPHPQRGAANMVDSFALMSLDSASSSDAPVAEHPPLLTRGITFSPASMTPHRHPPNISRRSHPAGTSPVASAPLLLLRRRSRAPTQHTENAAPIPIPTPSPPNPSVTSVTIPGVTILPSVDDQIGPSPAFSFGSCPIDHDLPSSESASRPSLPLSAGVGPFSPSVFGFGVQGLERRSTPTAELGPFEYPAIVDERKTSSASSSSHNSHLSANSLLSRSSRSGSGGTLQSPVKVAPPLPPFKSSPSAGSVPTLPQSDDRYVNVNLPRNGEPHSASVIAPQAQPFSDAPALHRRGSIALGQIPKLARATPGRPRGHTSTGSLTLSTGSNSVRLGSSPNIGGILSQLHPDGQRSTSAGNPATSNTPGTTPKGSPCLSPVASPMTGPVYLLPRSQAHGGGGPIAFAHSALPAPIPPSLLARRGSVPANLIWGLQGQLPQGLASPTSTSNTPGSYRHPLPSPSAVPKLFLPPRRSLPRQRRWSKEGSEPPDVGLLERPSFERTGTTGLINLSSDRSIPLCSPSGDKPRPASMFLAPLTSTVSRSPSLTASSAASPRSTSSSDRPTLSSANSDVTLIDALMDDERGEQVESLDDSENAAVEVETYPDAELSASPLKAACDVHPNPPDHGGEAKGAPIYGEHGAHSGHSNGSGHEAHFPDPCANGQSHIGQHSPLSWYTNAAEHRRYGGIGSYPLSTVPSSDGTDGGAE